MVLAFRIDPATGVYQPPVTVFNGGKRSSLSGKRSKRKTRKSKRKSKKTMRRRR